MRSKLKIWKAAPLPGDPPPVDKTGPDLQAKPPAAPAPAANAEPEPPAWFKSFAEKVEGKFTQIGQDFGRVREKLKAEPEGAKPADAAPAAVTREDLTAALTLGSLMAGLPESAREKINARVAKQGYSAALEFAQDLAALLPAAKADGSPAEPKRPAPPGLPASGAQSLTPSRPRSKQEYFALKTSDPAAFKALERDDSFDPNNLPSRVLQNY